MSNFHQLDANTLQRLGAQLENLTKSFNAGFPGLQNAGRTGTSAISIDSLEQTMRSIALEDSDFLLTKDIRKVPAKQSVYNYVLKTAVGSLQDVWGTESFLPQEDQAQYMRVAEVLRVMGIRKTITHMAMLINEVGGYMADLESENDLNATLKLTEQLERALYVGGDYYVGSDGKIDPTIFANQNAAVRVIRGIQAQIREGNNSNRGIPGDFRAYGNNKLTYTDLKGAVLDRPAIDKICTAVRDARGRIVEGHCNTDQVRHLRASFFPFERSDQYASGTVSGAMVGGADAGFPIGTVTGDIRMVPSVFKYNRIFPEASIGLSGTATPVISGSAQNAGSTSYQAGDAFYYTVQAGSVNGLSNPSPAQLVTVAADGNSVSLTISAQAGVEEFLVFRTKAGESADRALFIGKVLASRSGSTIFVDADAIKPGLDSVVFLPKKEDRVALAVLGDMVQKLELGLKGTAQEKIYVSYLAGILEKPRHHGLIDNVYSEVDFQ